MNRRIFWPIVLIALGVLFLLDNLGLLPGSAWGWLWPLLLIWLGASLLLRRGRGEGRGEDVSEDALALEGATEARLTVHHGAGRLEARAGAAPGLLYSGAFGGGVQRQVDRQGSRLDVHLRPPRSEWTDWIWPWTWIGNAAYNWNLSLNADTPLALRLETGASENRLDLAELRVTELVLKSGASSTEVTLPAAAGHTRVRIETGAAEVRVIVPPGVAARIRGQVGVGALKVDQERFPRRDHGYESADFETAANRVELEAQIGAAEVSVR